jgi:hypothetical protein
MKKIYDYFLTQLNNNTDGLVYKGNFLFRFFTDEMKVYDTVENKLVKEAVEFRPVSLRTSEDVPFVENNGRVDWLLEFELLAPLKGQIYDETTDLDYANVKTVCTALNGAVVTVEGTKYAIKVSPYPKYRGWDFLGAKKYAILSIVMNLTEVESGEFGQDSEWTLDGVALDVINQDIVTTRRFYSNDKKNTSDNDFNRPSGRVKMVTLTINYDPDNVACQHLFNESRSARDLKTTYTLVETTTLDTYSNEMYVRSAGEASQRNSVRRLVVEFVEEVKESGGI